MITEEMYKKVVIITGISGSGKTTLLKELLKRGWKTPSNFTTRKPRHNMDLDEDWDFIEDEYVYITPHQFGKKIVNGDFLTFTRHDNNFYGISRFIPDWNIVLVLNNPSRDLAVQYFVEHKINYEIYNLVIPIEEQIKRLNARWDDNIENRLNEGRWYTMHSEELNGMLPVEVIANIVEWVL